MWGKDDDDWMEVSVIQRSPHSNPPCVASTPISNPVIPSAFVETVTISNESEVIRFQSALKSSSELLLKLGSLIPKGAIVGIVDNKHYGVYKSDIHTFNHEKTVGVVDLKDTTFLSPWNAVSIDMMHIFHNIIPPFMNTLFSMKNCDGKHRNCVEPIDRYSDREKQNILNSVLNEGRELYSLSDDVDFFSVPTSIREKIRQRYHSLKELPRPFNEWVPSFINGGMFPKRKGEEKMLFAFCFLPIILIDCMDDPKVWSFVSIIVLLSKMYNHDGSFFEAELYQRWISFLLYVLEMQMEPSFSSISLHYCIHLLECFPANGPLKQNDSFHCEGQYCGICKEATGGKKPMETMARRIFIRTEAKLLSFGVKLREKSVGTWTLSSNKQLLMLVTRDQSIMKRTVINWVSDSRRLENDLVPEPTMTDVEFCGGLKHFNISGTITEDVGMRGGDVWYSSPEDVNIFYMSNGYTQFHCGFNTPILWESFSVSGKVYKSTRHKRESLTTKSFRNGGFAVTYSFRRQFHLFGVLGYLSFKKEDMYYMQALVYEIPVKSICPFIDSPFCFRVDLNDVNKETHLSLVSIHRLHIFDLWFSAISGHEVFGAVLSLCVRQWVIFSNLYVKPPVLSMKRRDTDNDHITYQRRRSKISCYY